MHAQVLVRMEQELKRLQAVVARQNIHEFARFVMRDEATGSPFEQPPIHQRMQKAIDDYDRLVLWGFIESGKSSQFVARILWEIGKNPLIRILLCSATGGSGSQGVKLLRTVKRYIEESEEYRLVFPHVRPGSPWSDELIYVGGAGARTNPTLRAIGAFNDVLGSRLDRVIADDLIDFRNSLTAHRREAIIRWFQSSVLTRVVAGGKVVWAGNAWDEDDGMHHMAALPGWHSIRIPVKEADGTLNWEDRWPEERIVKAEEEFEGREASRALYCKARRREDQRFLEDWIQRASQRGMELPFRAGRVGIVPTTRIVVGVDIGIGRKAKRKRSSLTVLTAVGQSQNGTSAVLYIESGKFSGPEIVRRILAWEELFDAEVYVEDVAAQQLVIDFAAESNKDQGIEGVAPRVFGFTTGINKHDPETGVEALVGGMMERGKLALPCRLVQDGDGEDDYEYEPEVATLVRDMRDYHPEEHTGDHLMSLWIAVEALRTTKPFEHRISQGSTPEEPVVRSGVIMPRFHGRR